MFARVRTKNVGDVFETQCRLLKMRLNKSAILLLSVRPNCVSNRRENIQRKGSIYSYVERTAG